MLQFQNVRLANVARKVSLFFAERFGHVYEASD